MLTEFEQIKVPKNLVNAAISQGVAQAKPVKHRRHLVVGTVIGLAAAGLLATITPVAIQAGGIVPAYQQLLDPSTTQSEHWDPTLNQLLGDFASTNVYHPLHVAAQDVNGIKVQPIGTMASAGVSAVIVDYSGPGIDPNKFDQANVSVNNIGAGQDIDFEANAAKVALGHYRQVIAWYPPITGDANTKGFDLKLSQVNGSTHDLSWQNLSLPQFKATTRQLTQAHTAQVIGGSVTVALTKVQASGQSLVLNYQTSFDPKKLTAHAQKVYQEAAWISRGIVYQNGHEVGDLSLGIGGQNLAVTHHDGLTQANFQSTFATYYRALNGKRTALTAGDVVKFDYDLPGKEPNRQAPATFTVPASQLLP
jgi:hypothetical protein